jgi:acyl-CoA synthetase (AMP-forming)/AMP-acid ligase II
MYTSGTTGRPKGVMITHAGVLALSEAWAFELSADLGHRILLSMPFFHIGSRSQGAALTMRGGTMVVHRAFDPKAIATAIQRDRITQLHLAPTMLEQVLDLPDIEDYDFSSLVTLNYAAAPMPLTTLKRALRRFGPILINGYGQTEREVRRLASVGQPVYDSAVRIVDDEDRDVPVDEVGEICFRSRQVMLGYWNNTAATVETLRGGWLHTGDLGRMDADGFVYLVDRKKDMIVTGGENVYSREVEEAIGSHPSVAEVAVVGLPDAKWGEAVTAIVVAKAGVTPDAAELLAHCRTQIAGYKCPKGFEFTGELPRVPSGKVNKVELRNLYKPA